MSFTFLVGKTKALFGCAVTAQLISVFVFAYANRWFSGAAAHFIVSVGVPGESCTIGITESCSDSNSACVSNTCQCNAGYYNDNAGTCQLSKKHNDLVVISVFFIILFLIILAHLS